MEVSYIALFLICEYNLIIHDLTYLDSWSLVIFNASIPWNGGWFKKTRWCLQGIEVLKETVLLNFTLRNCFIYKSSFFWLASSNSHSFEYSEYYHSCVDFFFTEDYTGWVSLNYEVYGKYVFLNLSEYLS